MAGEGEARCTAAPSPSPAEAAPRLGQEPGARRAAPGLRVSHREGGWRGAGAAEAWRPPGSGGGRPGGASGREGALGGVRPSSRPAGARGAARPDPVPRAAAPGLRVPRRGASASVQGPLGRAWPAVPVGSGLRSPAVTGVSGEAGWCCTLRVSVRGSASGCARCRDTEGRGRQHTVTAGNGLCR